eukprot:1189674-Amphidinium_carterae.1
MLAQLQAVIDYAGRQVLHRQGPPCLHHGYDVVKENDMGTGFVANYKTASNIDYLRSEGGMLHVLAILDDAHLPSIGFEAMKAFADVSAEDA